MNLYAQFETSIEAETDGVPLNYGDGVVVRVARAGQSNAEFRREYKRVFTEADRRLLQMDALPEGESREKLAELYARTIIKGWDGVRDRNNEEIPCTPENVKRVLVDLPDFFSAIIADASNPAHFKLNAEAVGNASPSSSSGVEAGATASSSSS